MRIGRGGKALVVLGAGAAHDVWDTRTPLKGEDWKPPLARQLFDFREKPQYHAQVAERYHGVRRLAPELAKYCQRAVVDLEAKLREYADHSEEKVRKWFWDIPPYLRDLLTRCSFEYVADAGHYDLLLKKLVLDSGHSVAFIVLNYDTLLERSLRDCFGKTFASFDSYARTTAPGIGPVVKLHGSINWFIQIGDRKSHQSWRDRIGAIGDPTKITIDWDLKGAEYFAPTIVESRDATERVESNGQYVYPLLTVPMAGKSPEHRVCPASHLRALQEFCVSCRKILIIGSSGVDDNLVHILKTSIREEGIVHYVGREDIADAAGRFDLPAETVDKFGGGFGEYLTSGAFEIFLNWQSSGRT